MAAPCSLAAMGMLNSLGGEADAIRQRLLIADQSRLSTRSDLVPDRSVIVAAVAETLPEIPDELAPFACRNNAMALAALQQIEEELRAAKERFGPHRIAVIMGTSTSGVSDAEDAIRHHEETSQLAPSFDYAQLEFGGVSEFVAAWLGVTGPAYTLSTACSSGARALASARSLLRLGLCDAVVAGAADTLCGLTLGGFSSLQAVSPEVTNPMSVNRQGLTLGEGAAVFLVTQDEGGVQLAGAGESSEAHHMSAPDPEGRGAVAAMTTAIQDAEAQPADVSYVNLHGTGTPLNDVMESHAVAQAVGLTTPCSSTKPLVGHTLGAAGAIEAAFAWLLLDQSQDGSLALPPHAWDGERDPELAALRLAEMDEHTKAGPRALVLSNSFGFGGNNCSLILERRFS